MDTQNLYPFTYLEVAPVAATTNAGTCWQSGLTWSSGYDNSGLLTSHEFGQGYNNTLTLLATCTAGVLGNSAYDLIASSIRDGWFVPSLEEMKVLLNQEKLGRISPANPVLTHSTYENVMTSTHAIGNSLSAGTPFWGFYGNLSPADQYSLQVDKTEGETFRLIRAG